MCTKRHPTVFILVLYRIVKNYKLPNCISAVEEINCSKNGILCRSENGHKQAKQTIATYMNADEFHKHINKRSQKKMVEQY